MPEVEDKVLEVGPVGAVYKLPEPIHILLKRALSLEVRFPYQGDHRIFCL